MKNLTTTIGNNTNKDYTIQFLNSWSCTVSVSATNLESAISYAESKMNGEYKATGWTHDVYCEYPRPLSNDAPEFDEFENSFECPSDLSFE